MPISSTHVKPYHILAFLEAVRTGNAISLVLRDQGSWRRPLTGGDPVVDARMTDTGQFEQDEGKDRAGRGKGSRRTRERIAQDEGKDRAGRGKGSRRTRENQPPIFA